jgi:hypothetical protein
VSARWPFRICARHPAEPSPYQADLAAAVIVGLLGIVVALAGWWLGAP